MQTFNVNSLNQLTTGSRSGTFTAAGTTTSPATNVTVNSLTAIRYLDNTFARTNLTLVGGTNTFTAVAQDSLGRSDTNIVMAYLPASPSFIYDANGNLAYDGHKALEYDDENQLTKIIATNLWKSEFVYDGRMRRRVRREYFWMTNYVAIAGFPPTNAWVLSNEMRYVYDGNLVIQERNTLNVPTASYTRGGDLSASFEGAGGIGGLLARSDHSSLVTSHSYYHADGNGNVTTLIDTNQTVVARYAYESFGRVLSMSGPLAEANPYRFSSKESHSASGLIYYLYRYYDSNLQRWINRDPLREEGFDESHHSRLMNPHRHRKAEEIQGPNLYHFVQNDSVNQQDYLGLAGGTPSGTKGEGHTGGPPPASKGGGRKVGNCPSKPCSKAQCLSDAQDWATRVAASCLLGCAFTGPGYLECVGGCSTFAGAVYAVWALGCDLCPNP